MAPIEADFPDPDILRDLEGGEEPLEESLDDAIEAAYALDGKTHEILTALRNGTRIVKGFPLATI